MTEFNSHPEGSVDWTALRARLHRLALAITGRNDEADDLTHDVLASLLARDVRTAAHLGYARQALVRRWLDQQRSLRRRLARVAGLALFAPRAHRDSESLSDAEQAGLIRCAVERLPLRQRLVLVLRLVEEQDYEEIAQILECSVESVRSNLHLARRAVRLSLGEAP